MTDAALARMYAAMYGLTLREVSVSLYDDRFGGWAGRVRHRIGYEAHTISAHARDEAGARAKLTTLLRAEAKKRHAALDKFFGTRPRKKRTNERQAPARTPAADRRRRK